MATTVTSTEPDFETLTTNLAVADEKAKGASADASEARAQRSQIATNAILAAFREKLSVTDVRSRLLDAGVLKGTVSKITTVVEALQYKKLAVDDVKSLNGAYSAVIAARKAAALKATAAVTTGVAVSGKAVSDEKIAGQATTPAQALKLIVDSIKNEKNDEKAFKLGGEWITKITREITDVLKAREEASEK